MALSISSFRRTLKIWFRGGVGRQSLAEQAPFLTEWYKTACGEVLLEAEMSAINQTLPSLFGYHLLQMSIHQEADLGRDSPIHNRFHILSVAEQGLIGKRLLRADFNALPLESDSVDVIILHHILEFSPNPHQILKEVSRVLIPRGHIIIVGFNPFSLFGLWKSFAALLSRQPQWRYNAITKWRLQDWFKFLDLSKTQITETFYRPPCSSIMLLERLKFFESFGCKLRLPLGGAYVMVARKDVTTMTPIRAPWEKISRRLPNLAASRPATYTPTYTPSRDHYKKEQLH